MVTDEDRLWFDRAAGAEYLGISTRTLDRRRAEGRGPAEFRDPVTGTVRFRRDDLDRYLERQRVEPIDDVVDALSDETREELRKRLAEIRRRNPAAIAALIAAVKYDPGRCEPIARDALADAEIYRLALPFEGLAEVELVNGRGEADWIRRGRVLRREPEWSVLDVETWRLIEPRLAADRRVILFSSTAGTGFPVMNGTGTKHTFRFFPPDRGRMPLPPSLFAELQEVRAFREAMARGFMREERVDQEKAAEALR